MIRRRSSARAGDAFHWRFRPLPGSDYVASGFALGLVVELLERRRPRSILEVGAGIGTLTATVAETLDRLGERSTRHVAVEEIPFCLDQLAANLGDRLDRVVVVPFAAEAPPDVPAFDLVVIDGGATTDLLPEDRHRWTAADERAEVACWMARLAPGALVVVENERLAQRSHIEAEATRAYVHEQVRPLDGTPGAHLYWFDPSPRRRADVAVREAARSLWFPRGVRLRRRIRRRLTGSAGPERAAVAPGDQGPTGS